MQLCTTPYFKNEKFHILNLVSLVELTTISRTMIKSERFCLKWNDFRENICSSFSSLRTDTDLTDVTLACEDGQRVAAHKIILAAASPLFKNMFKMNRHPSPLIYMRGMKSEYLFAIIEFIYCGETNIYHENIDDFLAIADELRLVGLRGVSNAPYDERKNIGNPMKYTEQIEQTSNHQLSDSSESIQSYKTEVVDTYSEYQLDEPRPHDTPTKENLSGEANVYQENLYDILAVKLKLKNLIVKPNDANDAGEIIDDLKYSSLSVNPCQNGEINEHTDYHNEEPILPKTPEHNKKHSIDDGKELDDKIKSMWIRTQIDGQRIYVCKLCGKKDNTNSHITQHVEANHIKGFSNPCRLCDKILKTRVGLKKHNLIVHKA